MNERIKELIKAAGEDDKKVFLEKFADLIRADEREACAKVCDKQLKKWALLAGKDKAYKWLEKLAVTIRARGNT
jgi:hypothetical protein